VSGQLQACYTQQNYDRSHKIVLPIRPGLTSVSGSIPGARSSFLLLEQWIAAFLVASRSAIGPSSSCYSHHPHAYGKWVAQWYRVHMVPGSNPESTRMRFLSGSIFGALLLDWNRLLGAYIRCLYKFGAYIWSLIWCLYLEPYQIWRVWSLFVRFAVRHRPDIGTKRCLYLVPSWLGV
jgi:hypothetical protein